MVQLSLIAAAAFATVATATKASVKGHHTAFDGLATRVKNHKAFAVTPSIRGASIRDLKGKMGKKIKKSKKSKKSKGGSSHGTYFFGYTAFDGPSCDGNAVEAGGYILDTCEPGMTDTGITYSRTVTSSKPGEPLSMLISWYAGSSCEGTPYETNDFINNLPDSTGLTFGDCFEGSGLQLDYFELDGPLDPGFPSILKSTGSTLDNCASGEFTEHYAYGDDYCFEDDSGGSFKYNVDTCATTGTFQYTTYSDTSCTTDANAVTRNVENDFCKFDIPNVYVLVDDATIDIMRFDAFSCITTVD